MKKILLTAAQHDLLKTMLDTAIEAAQEAWRPSSKESPRIAEMREVWHACARATTEPAFEDGRPEAP